MLPLHQESFIWQKATHLCLQLTKHTRRFPVDDAIHLSSRIRQDAELAADHLGHGAIEPTFRESLRHLQESYQHTLRLRREIMVSRYLGYLEEGTFEALEEEILFLLYLTSQQMQHFRYLDSCLEAGCAYGYWPPIPKIQRSQYPLIPPGFQNKSSKINDDGFRNTYVPGITA